MNSKNSKTSDPFRLLNKYIALSNLIIIIHLGFQLQHKMKNLNYLRNHIQNQIF